MKGVKIIMGLVALIGASNALAGGFSMAPRQSNYQQFITRYRDPIIDERLNIVAPAFVYEAAKALRADGTVNLAHPDVATYLWRSIDNVVSYYANLPANRNNRDFKTRIWQSLVRSLDELARTQQPMVQQQVMQPSPQVRQAAQPNAGDSMAELKKFRENTSQIIQTNPTYFYSAGVVQPSWLREALYLLTERNGVSLTMQNQASIREELARTAVELMRQILRNDPRNLSESQKNNILQMIRVQVEQFVDSQVMRSRI